MIKKTILCALLLTTATQFGMQMPPIPSVKKIKDTVAKVTAENLSPFAQEALLLGAGILAAGYLVTRAINYYYADEIISEVAISPTIKIIQKKITAKCLEGYTEYKAEIINAINNEIYGCICYSVPRRDYTYHYALHPHIDALKIAPNQRGNGYGSALVTFALSKIVAAQCEQKTISLTAVPYDLREGETTEEMLPKLIKFYEKLGAKLLDKTDRGALMRFDL